MPRSCSGSRTADRSTTARAAPLRLADGTIRENPARPLAQVDKFRAHDYGLIPVERYFELKGKRQLDYISSQGCNFRCAFCSDPFVYGRKWVGLEPVRMATRLKELWDRYHFDDVNFQDETFFTKAEPRGGAGRSNRRVWNEDHLGGHHARRSGRAAAGRSLGALQAVRLAPAAGRRRVGFQRGVEAHSQGHQDRAGVRDRGEDAASTASPATFPSSSAFPTRAMQTSRRPSIAPRSCAR